MVTVDEWRALAAELPEATERAAWGLETWRIRGKIFTSIDTEAVIGIAISKDERAVLLAAEPDKFFLKPGHDDGFNWMRVRLSAVGKSELRELLSDAWRLKAPRRLSAAADETDRPSSVTEQLRRDNGRTATDGSATKPGEIVRRPGTWASGASTWSDYAGQLGRIVAELLAATRFGLGYAGHGGLMRSSSTTVTYPANPSSAYRAHAVSILAGSCA